MHHALHHLPVGLLLQYGILFNFLAEVQLLQEVGPKSLLLLSSWSMLSDAEP